MNAESEWSTIQPDCLTFVAWNIHFASESDQNPHKMCHNRLNSKSFVISCPCKLGYWSHWPHNDWCRMMTSKSISKYISFFNQKTNKNDEKLEADDWWEMDTFQPNIQLKGNFGANLYFNGGKGSLNKAFSPKNYLHICFLLKVWGPLSGKIFIFVLLALMFCSVIVMFT